MRRSLRLGLLALSIVALLGPATHSSAVGLQASVVPPCFGAAARALGHNRCKNPSLNFSVVPRPSDAELETGDGCQSQERADRSWMCSFGPTGTGRPFALVGDSHAGHWRPAVASVALAYRWSGISITRAGCPYSTAVPSLAPELRASCIDWNQRVISWFSAHPELSVVFFSEHSGAHVLGQGNVVLKGHAAFAAKVAGYIAAWSALPPSVKHIIVIRDTPLNRTNSIACVEGAIARHQQAGVVCAVRRRFAVKPDPEVAAAIQSASPRVQVVDLTRLFCDRHSCFPVIGGALVHKDPDHLTTEFSASLGPSLVARVAQLTAAPSWAR